MSRLRKVYALLLRASNEIPDPGQILAKIATYSNRGELKGVGISPVAVKFAPWITSATKTVGDPEAAKSKTRRVCGARALQIRRKF
jgi:hypothetical protein